MKKNVIAKFFILIILGFMCSCSKKVNKENNAAYFKNYRDAIDFIESKGFMDSLSETIDDYKDEDVQYWLSRFPEWIEGFDHEDHVMSLNQLNKTKGYFIVLLYDKNENKWNQALLLHKDFMTMLSFWNNNLEIEESWGDSWIRYYAK